MKKKWYVASLIIECRIGGTASAPVTVMEQISVIQSETDDAALEKALRLGKEQEHSYENKYGETVSWVFRGLANLEEMLGERIVDGTEIRSRIFEVEDPAELITPKDSLLVYWAQRVRYKTALEIIQESE